VRVSCLQENLAKGLSIVGRAVSSRSTLPVLANILLDAKDNQLRLAATNLDIGVTCWIGAKVEDEGAITVPARLLTEFVNSLPPERIDMELQVRTQTLHLSCQRTNANMKGVDAAEFPIIPDVGAAEDDDTDRTRLELETTGLRKMIDQVVFAASSDESRPTLMGVEVSFSPARLTMAATDGYRLSVRSATLETPFVKDVVKVIVPSRSLGELGRIIADADAERPVQAVLTQARNQIMFQVWGKGEGRGAFQRVELVSQLIDANFPDYRAIIPKSHTTRTVVDTASFIRALRQAQIFARDNNNIVRVSVIPGNGQESGHVRLTATSAQLGDSVNELDALVEGTELEIAFDVRFLTDVLGQIDEPQVVLETTQSTRPGTIRPLGMGEDEFLHVVMPMHPPR
jgi:DNA polymerase-3 subunit beta